MRRRTAGAGMRPGRRPWTRPRIPQAAAKAAAPRRRDRPAGPERGATGARPERGAATPKRDGAARLADQRRKGSAGHSQAAARAEQAEVGAPPPERAGGDGSPAGQSPPGGGTRRMKAKGRAGDRQPASAGCQGRVAPKGCAGMRGWMAGGQRRAGKGRPANPLPGRARGRQGGRKAAAARAPGGRAGQARGRSGAAAAAASRPPLPVPRPPRCAGREGEKAPSGI